jgi:hypothetical protein
MLKTQRNPYNWFFFTTINHTGSFERGIKLIWQHHIPMVLPLDNIGITINKINISNITNNIQT